MLMCFFFFNDTATAEIYTLSLHDALPISRDVIHPSDQGSQDTALAFGQRCREAGIRPSMGSLGDADDEPPRLRRRLRSEEHTSELQSRQYLVCRLLLETKKQTMTASMNNE